MHWMVGIEDAIHRRQPAGTCPMSQREEASGIASMSSRDWSSKVELELRFSMPCRCTEDWLPLGPIAPSWLIRWSNPWLNTGEPLGCQPLSNLTTTLVFKALHQFKDTIGRVIRLCLSLGVTAVFAPPRETGFQAAVESFNARWQANVWQRFHLCVSEFITYNIYVSISSWINLAGIPIRRLINRRSQSQATVRRFNMESLPMT